MRLTTFLEMHLLNPVLLGFHFSNYRPISPNQYQPCQSQHKAHNHVAEHRGLVREMRDTWIYSQFPDALPSPFLIIMVLFDR